MFRSVRFLLAISVLVLASLACQALAGGDDAPVPAAPIEQDQPAAPEPTEAGEQPSQPEESAALAPAPGLGIETEFPFPDDANSCMDLGSSGVMCFSGKPLEEILDFYRNAFTEAGYKEREINTVVEETVLSLVFDGHTSGKAVVLQCVDLGGGSVTINLRLE